MPVGDTFLEVVSPIDPKATAERYLARRGGDGGYMEPLGFGQITGIDIAGEVAGVLPSQEWKRKAYKRPEHQKWYPGETISLGIGQGYNTFTMTALALWITSLIVGLRVNEAAESDGLDITQHAERLGT